MPRASNAFQAFAHAVNAYPVTLKPSEASKTRLLNPILEKKKQKTWIKREGHCYLSTDPVSNNKWEMGDSNLSWCFKVGNVLNQILYFNLFSGILRISSSYTWFPQANDKRHKNVTKVLWAQFLMVLPLTPDIMTHNVVGIYHGWPTYPFFFL